MTGAKRNKVLLVDDDDALRQSLGEQLRLHEDFITVEAGTGTEALNLPSANTSTPSCSM